MRAQFDALIYTAHSLCDPFISNMLLPLLLSLLLSFNVSGLEGVVPDGAATLLAPIYRNVTADDVWVYPNSSFDLGARSMTCECFDPSGMSM